MNGVQFYLLNTFKNIKTEDEEKFLLSSIY